MVLGMLNSFSFSNSNFVCKIRILFELRLGLWYNEFVLYLTVHLQYFIQHGFHVMVLNSAARSHFTVIDCMFYNVLCATKEQHQCIIYCMHCRSVLSENSGQISI